MPQRYIVSHASMRGIAALLVVMYHLQFGGGYRFAWEQATPFFRSGYLWVDLFFILSGFVISYSMRTEERAPFRWPQVKSFWMARFARIYPLHFVCLFALLFANAGLFSLGKLVHRALIPPEIFSGQSMLDFAIQLSLLNAWGISDRVDWNIPSWSISAEAVIYVLFPLLAAGTVRGGRLTLAAMGLSSLAFYLWIGMTTGVLDLVQGIALLRCIAGFMLGMILYSLRDNIDMLPDWVLGAMQLSGLVLVIMTLLFGLNDVLAIPGFFLLVAATWSDRGWLTRPLTLGPLVWLGDISYSVYLTHVPLLQPWRALVPRITKLAGLPQPEARAIFILGAVAMILTVSHLTYRYVERPARRAIVDWSKRRDARRAMTSLPVGDRLN